MEKISVSHYLIKNKIGAGGMGEVYLAEDTKLQRVVALKILPAGFLSDVDRIKRFTREARAASAISHENVAHIYDIGEENGLHFIAMEYVDGRTIATILRDGPFAWKEVVRIAAEILDALQEAREKGVIHRDIKPANIMLTKRGHVKLLDFGLAKLVLPSDSDSYLTTATQTELGTVMGTLPYMSPEQLRGKELDHRTDLFSLGCVLYQMTTGKLPFQGKTSIELADAILNSQCPPAHEIHKHVPRQLSHLISKLLEKDPQLRYQSANDVLTDLQQLQPSSASETPPSNFSKRALLVSALCIVAVLAVFAFRFYRHQSKVRWAREEALPEIMQLVDAANYPSAVELAKEAEKYIPEDLILKRLWPTMSASISVTSSPPAADVYMQQYAVPDSPWEHVGKTPITDFRIPKNYFRWKIVKADFVPVYRVAPKAFYESDIELSVDLDAQSTAPADMARIPGGPLDTYHPLILPANNLQFGEYWIDLYEVTNKKYKEFVDSGGYTKKEFWKQPFIKDGKSISWEEAMTHFRDATGRPGPLRWEVGNYSSGTDDYPVTGISWYEAAAYAEFAGKSLPTVYHWLKASGVWMSAAIIPLSNFNGQRPHLSALARSLSPYGTYNMAGNVKEWCWNQTLQGKRFILGGSYNEPSYLFHEPDQRSPFDREETFGFRCVKYRSLSDVPPIAFSELIRKIRDYNKERPVSDEVFNVIKQIYDYTTIDLQPAVVETKDERYWRKEKISFNAAYGKEKVIAHIFLPKNAKPPYQAVIFFPGSWAQEFPSSANIESDEDYRDYLEFLVRAGRAAVYPIYKGTFERGGGEIRQRTPDELREWTVQFIKDVRRTVDYLHTRSDIDTKKLAFYGYSWGARIGSLVGVVEPRLQTLILAHGGLPQSTRPTEIDEINFCPRVKMPVLMINGQYDHVFPVESSQKPFFRLLGTPDAHKKYLLLDGGHHAPRNEVIGAVLDWLDRYLGKV